MVRQSFFSYFSKLPSWGGTPPKAYNIPYSFDKLRPGIDNVYYDVFLSPGFCRDIGKIVFQFIVKHAGAEKYLDRDAVFPWLKERDKFQHLCTELLTSVVDKARGESSGAQLDYLVQTTIAKTLLNEIRVQFENLIEKFNSIVWEKEISYTQDLREVAQVKEKTASLRQQRKTIIYNTSKELFGYLLEIQQRNINPLRRRYFADGALLPGEFFANPLIYQGSRLEDSSDDTLMIEEYVLLSRREAEPNTYETILAILTDMVGRIELDTPWTAESSASKGKGLPPHAAESEDICQQGSLERDGWLKHSDTIDILFNYFQTEERIGVSKGDATEKDQQELKNRLEEQKKFLTYCYKEFEKKGLIDIIAASCELKAIYKDYCPPLVPQQILQFLVTPKASRDIETQLQRAYKIYGHSLSLDVLKSVTKRLLKLTVTHKQNYLVDFMKGFVRYHRDLGNFNILRMAMDRVSLISDVRSYDLAKANNTLYEFLLPHEQETEAEERPVQKHVIVNVDLRGLADISRHFAAKGLQSASYLSRHLFGPVSGVVTQYAASKLLVEQGAIVLAIVERQGAGERSYTVARACGLAMQLMMTIQRFNTENIKKQLPVLEVGIGVGFEIGPPIFAFDGESKIAISKALDDAVQLSAGSRFLPGLFRRKPGPYHIHLYPDASGTATSEDNAVLFMRSNINGIGLNRPGFEQLAKEIDLKPFSCDLSEFQVAGSILYRGEIPVKGGKYQPLIIREGVMPQVDTQKFQSDQLAEETFYEICINPELYAHEADPG
jgi:hypothetical protein